MSKLSKVIQDAHGLLSNEQPVPSASTIKAVMSELGRRGGQSTSDAKKKAVRKSLAKARKVRWSRKTSKQ